MDYLEFQELYHHGVKGQKWGVRKEERSAKRLEKRKEKPVRDAIKTGIITSGATVASSALAILAGRLVSTLGENSNNIGSMIAGNVISQIGEMASIASPMIGSIAGGVRYYKNKNLSKGGK